MSDMPERLWGPHDQDPVSGGHVMLDHSFDINWATGKEPATEYIRIDKHEVLEEKHLALREKCYGIGGYYWIHNRDLSEISRMRKIIGDSK